MNIDIKMLNVFKSNPAIYKKDNIHNQRGLILGIQGGFDIQKSIKVIHHFNRIKEKNHKKKKRMKACGYSCLTSLLMKKSQ